MHKATILLVAILLFGSSCNLFHPAHNPQKLGANDPFKNTMVKSEFFAVDAGMDNVVEGKKGTIVSLPKGCFVNSNGEEVNGPVKVELAEALNYADMIFSNLTTTSNGHPLKTDGMIYLNATTAGGERLSINKKKPVGIHIPTDKKIPGMMAYVGERDDNGNMNWVDPKPIENYLNTISIDELDFLPAGFAQEVKRGMPFKGYKTATKKLIDSLYYSLAAKSEVEQMQSKPPATHLNEPYYNPNAQVKNGKYTKDSYTVNSAGEDGSSPQQPVSYDTSRAEQPGIDPALIKTISSKEFQNTFIATHEFEERLRVIFQTCKNSILELYVKNTGKNLWEVDEMAAKQLGEETYLGKKFSEYAALKQTNVRNAADASLVSDYFDKQLNEVHSELAKLEAVAQQEVKEHNRVVDSVADAYRDLLWKREKYRMERYNFTWTDMGWVNIDTGWILKDSVAEQKKLEVKLREGKTFDRIETYMVFENIKSIYHLETIDKETYFAGQDPARSMLMIAGRNAKIVAIGYRGDSVYMGVTNYVTGSSEKVELGVSESTKRDVERVLNEIEKGAFKGEIKSAQDSKNEYSFDVGKPSAYAQENSISLDLAYQAYFYNEQKYRDSIQRENELLANLYVIAYPCACEAISVADSTPGYSETDHLIIEQGKLLYEHECSSCHSKVVTEDGTGPPLAGITSKRSMPWLIGFTRNWRDLVSQGDRLAIEVANSRPAEMNVFPTLNACEIRSIYRYIDSQGNVSK